MPLRAFAGRRVLSRRSRLAADRLGQRPVVERGTFVGLGAEALEQRRQGSGHVGARSLDQLVGGQVPGRGGRAFLGAVVLLRGQPHLILVKFSDRVSTGLPPAPPLTLTLESTTLFRV